MNLPALFQLMDDKNASDLHMKTNAVPIIRVHGNLVPVNTDPITQDDLQTAFQSMTSKEQQAEFQARKELDISYQSKDGHRFRVNTSLQKGQLCLAFRRISSDIPTLDELRLPAICKDLALKKQGLILVTGPTGCGKSTTLASMIHYLNQQEARRIVTVEDPIEYLHQDQKGFITQREIGTDTLTFAAAAKYALRQDPDVILVGEMRDPETMAACLTAAETGHLVLSTLHTNNAPQSIDRIVDSFPSHQQNQIRMQLSLTLMAILSQRLLSRLDGSGRVAAVEVMVSNTAIQNLIRDGKTHQMATVMQTGIDQGMQTMERALKLLYHDGLISIDDAQAHALDQRSFQVSLNSL